MMTVAGLQALRARDCGQAAGDVMIHTKRQTEPAARASLTFSIPPR